VRLFVPSGALCLFLLLVTGLVGAAAGLMIGSRGTVLELRGLLTSLRPTEVA
jgi:hypothetical protein